MKSLRILTIQILAILVLTCFAASGCVAQGRAGLSQNQKNQLMSLANDTRSKTMHERENLRRARKSLVNIYSKYKIDDSSARAAIGDISKSQRSLLSIHIENQIKIRKILSQSQFLVFNRSLKKRDHRPGFMQAFEDSMATSIMRAAMQSKLSMTQSQKKEIRQLLNTSSKRNNISARLKKNSAELISMFKKYDFDSTAANKLVDKIHNIQIDLLELNSTRQHILRSVLTESQFKTYQETVYKELSKNRTRKSANSGDTQMGMASTR